MDLASRCALGVSRIPVSRVPIFCASCAERFAAGYVAWSREEDTLLPSPEMVRDAIDACWSDSPDRALVTELTQSLMKDMPRDGQPLFTSMLSLYVVEISLLQEALAASAAADRSHALRCSEYALDFYLQLSDLRREVTGVKIDYADPGRDVRDFESDAEAAAEADRQLADAASLQSDALDVDEMRATSSAHGRRVLGAVMNQLETPQ